jgi:hypothetical protein
MAEFSESGAGETRKEGIVDGDDSATTKDIWPHRPKQG